jgi:hypothetical protein
MITEEQKARYNANRRQKLRNNEELRKRNNEAAKTWWWKHREEGRNYHRKYYLQHREEIIAKRAAYVEAHREEANRRTRERYYGMSDQERKLYIFKNRLSTRFGVTPEWYEKKFSEQNGKCAICGRTEKRRLAVDHDHACCNDGRKGCGKCNRGLLCGTCNRRLHAVEDRLWMESAVAYLKKFSKGDIE